MDIFVLLRTLSDMEKIIEFQYDHEEVPPLELSLLTSQA
jgi:hypothetical protein